ncbi:MAG: tetratricopeptide repeat protein [Chitinophagales bacterium]
MKRIAGLLLFLLSGISQSDAQSIPFDRNRLNDYFQNQQYDEAIHYLEPIAAFDSLNPQLLNQLGYAYYMNDQTRAALACFARVSGIDSNNITALYYLARMNANDHPELASMYTNRLIMIQPQKSVWRRYLGEYLQRQKLKDSAMVLYEEAYRLAPEDYKNIAALAEILIDFRDFTRADSVLFAGLERDSMNVTFLILQIRRAYEAKLYEKVLAPGEQLIRMEEVRPGSLKQLALAYYELKKYNDCIRVCEYLFQHQVEGESIYYYEAMAWAKLKEYEKSNELLQTCLAKAISKTAETYYYQLGLNEEELKAYKKAISNYDTAYYLFKDPLMKYNGGRIYESKLKNPKAAAIYYEEYLSHAKPVSAAEKKVYAYVESVWGSKKTKTGAQKK